MGKMMSILEKYKLIEKENLETSNTLDESKPNQSISLEATPSSEDDLTQISEELQTNREKEIEIEPLPTQETIEEVVTSEASSSYLKKMDIDAIYTSYGLGNLPMTESVYYLENLIAALPSEIPDYLKKTTVDNIIKVSQINLESLLQDGRTRTEHLSHFIAAYTANNLEEITKLKQEIDKLTRLITDYHQQIKLKENLIQEESELVEAENTRLTHILNFFES